MGCSETHRRDACATIFAVENSLPQLRQRAAQTFGDERLRLLPEPSRDGFALQQFGDGWKRLKQFLFSVGHNSVCAS